MKDHLRGRPVDMDPSVGRTILELHDQASLGAREIARLLEASAIAAPRAGARWHPSTITRFLRSRGIALPPGRPPRWAARAPSTMPTPLHIVTAVAWRRRRQGSGSDLWRLLRRPMTMEKLWYDLNAAFGEVPHAVIGAVAANRYMPPRQTGDVDFAVSSHDLPAAEAALRAAGWIRLHPLELRPPLTGWAWQSAAGDDVEVITVPDPWGQALVAAAMQNAFDGLPMATLPHMVALKMVAGRAIDAGDITRMVGPQSAAAVEVVRAICRRVLNEEDMADLEQLIELGKLEYGPKPPGNDGPHGPGD